MAANTSKTWDTDPDYQAFLNQQGQQPKPAKTWDTDPDYQAFLKDNDPNNTFLAKGAATVRGIAGGLKDQFIPQLKAQTGAALESGRPFDEYDWKDEAQQQADELAQQQLKDYPNPTWLGVSEGQLRNETGQQAPQLATNALGTVGGAVIGGLTAGPLGAGIGAMSGYLGGNTLALAPMYHTAKTQAATQFIGNENVKRQQQGQPAMTLPETLAMQERIQPDVEKHAGWEVATEVPGMLLEAVPGLGWVSKAAKPIAKPLSRAAFKAMGKAAAIEIPTILGTETLEEATSKIGQTPIENQYAIPGQQQPDLGFSLPGYVEAVKDVAGPTMRGMIPFALLGGGGAAMNAYGQGRQAYLNPSSAMNPPGPLSRAAETITPQAPAIVPTPEPLNTTNPAMADTAPVVDPTRYPTAEEAHAAAKAATLETGILHRADPDPANPTVFKVTPVEQTPSPTGRGLGVRGEENSLQDVPDFPSPAGTPSSSLATNKTPPPKAPLGTGQRQLVKASDIRAVADKKTQETGIYHEPNLVMDGDKYIGFTVDPVDVSYIGSDLFNDVEHISENLKSADTPAKTLRLTDDLARRMGVKPSADIQGLFVEIRRKHNDRLFETLKRANINDITPNQAEIIKTLLWHGNDKSQPYDGLIDQWEQLKDGTAKKESLRSVFEKLVAKKAQRLNTSYANSTLYNQTDDMIDYIQRRPITDKEWILSLAAAHGIENTQDKDIPQLIDGIINSHNAKLNLQPNEATHASHNRLANAQPTPNITPAPGTAGQPAADTGSGDQTPTAKTGSLGGLDGRSGETPPPVQPVQDGLGAISGPIRTQAKSVGMAAYQQSKANPKTDAINAIADYLDKNLDDDTNPHDVIEWATALADEVHAEAQGGGKPETIGSVLAANQTAEKPPTPSNDVTENLNPDKFHGGLSKQQRQSMLQHAAHVVYSIVKSKLDPITSRIVNAIPTFQGGKTKVAELTGNAIRAAFGGKKQDKYYDIGDDAKGITVINDLFAGSGGWGVFNALAHFTNVREINEYEYDASRMLKIKLFHNKGNQIGDIVRRPDTQEAIRQLKNATKTLSASAVATQADKLAEQANNDDIIGLMQAIVDQGNASFGTSSGTKHAGTPEQAVDDIIRQVIINGRELYEAVSSFKATGGVINYITGDTFGVELKQGNHILDLIDPPYYGTKGYNPEIEKNEEGKNTPKVPLTVYRQVHDLIARSHASGHNMIYTDEAWWLKKDSKGKIDLPPDRFNAIANGGKPMNAMETLHSITGHFDHFGLLPVGNRIETLGLYNARRHSIEQHTKGGTLGDVQSHPGKMGTDERGGKADAADLAGQGLAGTPIQPSGSELAGKSITPDQQTPPPQAKTGADKTLPLPQTPIVQNNPDTAEKSPDNAESSATPKPTAEPELAITKPTRMYHGTAANDPITKFSGITYVTDKKDEAAVFAENPVLNRGSTGQPRVLEVMARPGKIKDINGPVSDALMEDGDVEQVIAAELAQAEREGYAYVQFDHPGIDDYFTALVGSNYQFDVIDDPAYKTQPKANPNEQEPRQTQEGKEKTEAKPEEVKPQEIRHSKSTPLPDNTFYSALTRGVEQAKQPKAPAQQWKAIIKAMPGVKAEEVEWSDVNNWLDKQAGSVTREALVGYLKSQEVKLEEVWHGGGRTTTLDDKEIADDIKLLEANNIIPNKPSDFDDYVEFYDGRNLLIYSDMERYGMPQALVDAAKRINQHIEKGKAKATKYEDYKAKRGEPGTYRELLLTIPANKSSKADPIYQTGSDIKAKKATFIDAGFTEDAVDFAADAVDKAGTVKDGLRYLDVKISRGWGYAQGEKDAIGVLKSILGGQRLRDIEAAEEFRKINYTTSHFPDTPNIIAHVRFDERKVDVPFTDDEKAVIAKRERLQAEYDQLSREIEAAEQQASREEKPLHDKINREVLAEAKARKIAISDISSEQVRRHAELPSTPGRVLADKLHRKRMAIAKQIPDAPTPKTQRVLHVAEIQADKGQEWQKLKKKIDQGEATPEDQERFKFLSSFPMNKTETWSMLAFKRVLRYAAENGYDAVTWDTGETNAERYDLSKQVDTVKYAPDDELFVAQKDGKNVIEKENVKPNDLEGIIGKEVAKRLLESDTGMPIWKHSVSGIDLKTGGEGMKGFYDHMLPAAINKYVKQWGGKVSRTKVSGDVPAWQVQLTPEMQQAAMAGQVLFAKRQIITPGSKVVYNNPIHPMHGKIAQVVRKWGKDGRYYIKFDGEDGQYVADENELDVLEQNPFVRISEKENKQRVAQYLKKHKRRLSELNYRKAEPNEVFYRVIWGKTTELQSNTTNVVDLPQGDVYALHVTAEPDNWGELLADEYDRGKKYHVVEIKAMPGDIVVEDPQQVMPSEKFGRLLDSKILITGRTLLKQSKEGVYFAKRTKAFPGMSQEAAQRVVDAYLKGLKGLGDLKITVYPTQNAAGRGSNKQIIEAEFHIPTNTLRVIAENFKDAKHLLATLAEEVVGHYGLRQLLGSDHAQVMREVERAAKANPVFREEWIKLSGRDPRNGQVVNAKAPYFAQGASYDRAEIADEVLSKMARDGVENNRMRRIIDLITRLLRKIGVIRGPMSPREAMALIARSERGLRTGKGMASGSHTQGTRYHKAWHGSPHEVDEFKLQHIGTGEGSQAYGWGLYFADSRDVAEFYKNKLTPSDNYHYYYNGKIVTGFYELKAARIAHRLKSYFNSQPTKEYIKWRSREIDFVRPWDRAKFMRLVKKYEGNTEFKEFKGGLYQVDLAPKPSDYLDWDKPLSQQSPQVKAAIEQAAQGQDFPIDHDPKGSEVYGMISAPKTMGAEKASKYLLSLGIPGIKYKDGFSRATSTENYNYVIFDDSLVKIENRYSKLDRSHAPRGNARDDAPRQQPQSGSATVPTPERGNDQTPEELKPFKSKLKMLNPDDFNDRIEDDEYLYHVTTYKNGINIRKQGFVPNTGGYSTFNRGYAGTSKGKVFFTEKSGVSFWRNRMEMSLEQQYDKPPKLTVLQIPKSVLPNLEKDEDGSRDAYADAYYTTEAVRFSKRNAEPINPIDPNAAPVFADRIGGFSLNNLKDIPKFVKANLKGLRSLGLKTLGRQWLTEIYQDDLPGLKAHNKLMMAFDADPNERQARAGEVSQEWGGLKRQDADRLADIMHVSTVHGVDASKETYEPRYTPEQVEQDFFAELNETWEVYRKKRAVMQATQGNPPGDVMYEWQKALSDLQHMTFLKAETLDKMAQAYQKKGIQPDWEDSKPVQKGLQRRIKQRMKAEQERKAQWQALKTPWQQLTPKARELYATARDMYQQMWKDTEQALIERIERTLPEGGAERNRMIDRLRLIFRREVPEIYFPLHRDGEYVVVVKAAPDAAGLRKNVAVFREQSLPQAERLRKELQQRYADTTHEVMPVFKQPTRTRRDAADSAFVAQVVNLIGAEGGGHKMDQLRENVMELYYQALPDLSWAKHEMHRRKVPGYSRDARKAFAHHISHGANHLARIRYVDRLEKSLDEMQETVNTYKYSEGDDWDAIKAQDLVNSLRERHEYAMNPPNVPLANKLTSFGFVWYLGLSPASALVNTMQTPLVAGPVLGSKFGLLRSAGALTKASFDVVKALKFEGGRGIKGVAPSEKTIIARLRAQLSADEFKAIEKAIIDGHATMTLAHDLAGVAQGKEHSETMEAVLRAASFMFHQTELFNRLTTILAAYRLGRAKGLTHGGAYDQAIDLDYMAHFDYAANNRAPVIAGPVARVVTQFKQYQLNSITLWAHNGVQALLAMPNFLRGKGLDVRQKEAIKLFRGLLITHALAAGVLGLPLVGTFLAVASALGSDDDEPWDAEVALRNGLADALGPRFAEAVVHGVPRLGRDVIPADIAGRVGMDRLLFPDLQEGLEPVQWYKEFAVSMLGPVVGAGLNAAKGMQTWGDGDWARGLEEMSPKVVKDALKMARYAREGVKDKTGVEILDETSWGEQASQLLGFTPARVSEAMESRGAVYNLDRKLTKRRSELMDEYGDAIMNKESPKAVMAEIREFNQANPQLRITMDGIRQSLKMKRKRINQAQGGVYLPPKRRGERDVGRFFQG